MKLTLFFFALFVTLHAEQYTIKKTGDHFFIGDDYTIFKENHVYLLFAREGLLKATRRWDKFEIVDAEEHLLGTVEIELKEAPKTNLRWRDLETDGTKHYFPLFKLFAANGEGLAEGSFLIKKNIFVITKPHADFFVLGRKMGNFFQENWSIEVRREMDLRLILLFTLIIIDNLV